MSTATQFEPLSSKEAPRSAFRFDASVSTIKLSADGKTADIELLARSGDPIQHWYWGQIVHDLQGMNHKDKVVLDYCHDDEEVIGYADGFDVRDDGLHLSGKLVSVIEEDRADVVMRQGNAGIPFEASIFFDDAQLEYIPEGMSTEVNGKQFEGPGVIVRQWTLRGCAVCPYGADANTNSSFADSSALRFSWRPDMATKKKAGELTAAHATEEQQAATAAEPATATEAEATAEVTKTEPETIAEPSTTELSADDPRSQLKKFMQRFGDADGAKYFADGIDYQAAQDLHIGKLTADRDAAVKRADDAEARLLSLKDKHGEREGVKTGSASTGKFGSAQVKSISEAKRLAAASQN